MLPEPAAMPPPSAYPPHPERLPAGCAEQGRYRARFATTEAELDAILRLRFEVFNLELKEGLESSYATGRDEDRFDSRCHHLLVEDSKNGGQIIGTYRMQTDEMASDGGYYSAGEFDLSALPLEVAAGAVEVGRACIAREHRNRQTLFLLWKGLALYMLHNRKRFLFGCCSLTSQDGCEGLAALAHLEAGGFLHPTVRVPPLPGFECACDRPLEPRPDGFDLPVLFKTYLRYGALVCGAPAIDREFKTIDFLVLFDIEAMDRRTYDLYFE